MHDAYEAIPILEKLPLQIEAVTAYGEEERSAGRCTCHFLIRGEKSGILLVFFSFGDFGATGLLGVMGLFDSVVLLAICFV